MKYLLLILFISLTITGCSGESADDIMKSAKQNIEQQKFDEALKLYEKLVAEFPESDLAPTALYESAAIYQNKLIKNISEKESLLKAYTIFKEVYDKYPDSNEAAKSLFFAGFIKANEPVNEFKEATELYSLFIEKFPQHELAASAKAELDNMGIPVEDILDKDSVTVK